MATGWSDAFLDEMRQVGDPLADDVVTSLFQSSGVYAVGELMKTLVTNDHPTPDQLPAQLKTYLEATSEIPQLDPGEAAAGQHLFVTFGPEMMIVLLSYSLPACYADQKGVQVLYRSGYLTQRVNRRVFETAQMVMDVMTPGGLAPGGKGVRSAQKVRLMHAAVRWLILNNPEAAWDLALGFPINQEDLGFTLMTFAYVILDGLDKLGIKVKPEEQQGFLETWKMIGRIMGVQEALIPDDMAAAKTLYETVQKRQDRPCPEGKAMTQALLDMLGKYGLPGHALMRHFLSPELADGFGVEKHPFEEWLIDSAANYGKEHDRIADKVDRRFLLVRKVALRLIQGLVTAELGGKRTPFVLPTNLNYYWHNSEMPSLWQQLRR
jgi:hypothetical protein